MTTEVDATLVGKAGCSDSDDARAESEAHRVGEANGHCCKPRNSSVSILSTSGGDGRKPVDVIGAVDASGKVDAGRIGDAEAPSNDKVHACISDGTSVEVVKSSGRFRLLCCGSCCCCCLLTLALVFVILYFVYRPQMIDKYGVCRINVCEFEGDGALLADYKALEFSGSEQLGHTCALKLEAGAAAGEDLTVYISVWFHNPNWFDLDFSDAKVLFTRAIGGTEKELLTCSIGDFLFTSGDIFLDVTCTVRHAAKLDVGQMMSDYLSCSEVTIGMEVIGVVTVSALNLPVTLSERRVAVLNKASTCASSPFADSRDWIGGDPASCLGTTDVRIDMPSMWLCAVRLVSVFRKAVEIDVSVSNPSAFSLDIDSLTIEIYGGSDLGSYLGTITQTESVRVHANATVDILFLGKFASALAIAKLSRYGKVAVSGTLNLSVLGFRVQADEIPRTVIDTSDASSDVVDWSIGGRIEQLKDAVSSIFEVVTQVSGMLSGNCKCVYNCKDAVSVVPLPASKCEEQIGSTCIFTSCDASRNATCRDFSCVCEKGVTCAEFGACVPIR